MQWFYLLYDLDGRGALMDKGKKQARSVDTYMCVVCNTFTCQNITLNLINLKYSGITQLCRHGQKYVATIICRRKCKEKLQNSSPNTARFPDMLQKLETGFSELLFSVFYHFIQI